MSQWSKVLNAEELAERYALTASLDMGFARKQREFYEASTAAQLSSLAAGAWNCNDSDGYRLARSHLALIQPIAA